MTAGGQPLAIQRRLDARRFRSFPAFLAVAALDKVFYRGSIHVRHARVVRTRLARLASDHDTEPEVTRAVQIHAFAGGRPRRLAFQAMRDEPEAVLRGLREMLTHCGEEAFLAMIEATPEEEAAWARSVIAAAGPDLTPQARLRAYVRLAEMSAPEVVWAVELTRVGTLARMMPVEDGIADAAAGPSDDLDHAVDVVGRVTLPR